MGKGGMVMRAEQLQRGLALYTMLLMVAAIVIPLTYFVSNNGVASNAINTNNKATQLSSQARLIMQMVYSCTSNYPTGNNGGTTHLPYPATPTGNLVSNLVCPGTSANLWTGVDGAYLPVIPTDFGAWQYVNDATSVRITTTTTNLTAWANAINQVVSQFGSQASLSGSTLTITITN